VASPLDPFDDVRRDLREIKERNARVEREKAWETSWTRRLLIASTIYGGAWVWLVNLRVDHAPLQALVPSAAYLLSTFSLPLVKKWWMRGRFDER
jgi:hypothetical protein